MNRQKVAQELIAVAREMTAASDVSLVSVLGAAYQGVMNKIAAEIKKIRGVEKIGQKSRPNTSAPSYSISFKGYTRGDLEASGALVIYFRGYEVDTYMWGRRPDWGKTDADLMDGEKTKGVVPVRIIVARAESIFG